jgi:hypothetical protein
MKALVAIIVGVVDVVKVVMVKSCYEASNLCSRAPGKKTSRPGVAGPSGVIP